jgi:hypothetical protein
MGGVMGGWLGQTKPRCHGCSKVLPSAEPVLCVECIYQHMWNSHKWEGHSIAIDGCFACMPVG